MSSSDLSTTRINRLLRPLRVNCAQLAAHGTSSGSSGPSSGGFVTYLKSHAWRPSDKGPLALILPPHTLQQARTVAHAGSVRNAELARRIYAVHGALRNVLQAAFGDADGRQASAATPGLAALCAGVVGANIQEEVNVNLEPGVEADEEEAEMEIVNEMYEHVPPTYRRYVRNILLCTSLTVSVGGSSSPTRSPPSSTPARTTRPYYPSFWRLTLHMASCMRPVSLYAPSFKSQSLPILAARNLCATPPMSTTSATSCISG
jgi:hypothetical protein